MDGSPKVSTLEKMTAIPFDTLGCQSVNTGKMTLDSIDTFPGCQVSTLGKMTVSTLAGGGCQCHCQHSPKGESVDR